METDLSPDASIDRFLSRLNPVETLVVALSGGSDSMALLYLLHQRLAAAEHPRLIAVTIDHGLRPGVKDEIARVADACAAMGVAHRTARWRGRKPVSGLQEAARLARYDLLRRAALDVDAAIVVTGHTRDDQIETALMRNARGAGRGLAGMAEAMLYRRDCWIMRPLLPVRRDALKALLSDAGQMWIDDPSNRDTRFERVRLRRSGASGAADDEVLAMIHQAALARRADAVSLSRFLEQHAAIHAGIIAELPQVPAEISENLQQGIGLVCALMGGRAHRPGARAQAQIARFTADVGPPRTNLGRSVLDRRANRIFIYRERRGQRRMVLKPGQSAVWDERYLISNRDPRHSFILAPTRGQSCPTDLSGHPDPERPDSIPAGVWSRARLAEPTLFAATADGRPGEKQAVLPHTVTVERHLAMFDLFLPEFDYILADICAGLFGRPGYRKRPFRQAPGTD